MPVIVPLESVIVVCVVLLITFPFASVTVIIVVFSSIFIVVFVIPLIVVFVVLPFCISLSLDVCCPVLSFFVVVFVVFCNHS